MTTATTDVISEWFDTCKKVTGATHMIVVIDEFAVDDFPVIGKGEEATKMIVHSYQSKPLYDVLAVFDLSLPLEGQV